MVRFEVCVDSVASAIQAHAAGATSIELCAGLVEGGTTPSLGMVRRVRAAVPIKITVMIRPRGGDFLFTDEEFEIMKEDIKLCKGQGVDGFALGMLTAEGQIDSERLRELIDLCEPSNLTFHRAFDMVADPLSALETIIELEFDRVLTSGQQSSALEGSEAIAQFVQKAGDRIVVVPAGGITEHNVRRIIDETSAVEFHCSGRSTVQSAMTFVNSKVHMSAPVYPVSEYSLSAASSERLEKFKAALN